MKATIELIKIYQDALVDTVNYLDQIGHSDTHIRAKVDVALNHLDKLKENSEMELTKISLK